MTVLTSTRGQRDLPRYFGRVFALADATLHHGRLDIVLHDGRRFRAGGRAPGPVAEVEVHNPDLFARLLREGDLGFSDAYLEEWWSSPDLQAFMDLIHADNDGLYDGFPGIALVRAYERARHWLRANSKGQARKNIAHHYDLGNEFYKLWLDAEMQYTCAYFRQAAMTLEQAQAAKMDHVCRKLELKPGMTVVEAGCGWGALARHMALNYGVKVWSYNISHQQIMYARERAMKEGYGDRVEFYALTVAEFGDRQRLDQVAGDDVGHAIVRGAHEGADARPVRIVDDLHDRVEVVAVERGQDLLHRGDRHCLRARHGIPFQC